MIQAETVAVPSSLRSPVSAFFAPLLTLTLGWPLVGSAQAAPDLTTFFESPVDGQVVSGVGLIRGWALAEAGAVPPALGLMIDGQCRAAFPAAPRGPRLRLIINRKQPISRNERFALLDLIGLNLQSQIHWAE
jgi:hypothetical protein